MRKLLTLFTTLLLSVTVQAQFIYNMEDHRWTDSGTTYDAIKMTIFDSASAADSRGFNICIDGGDCILQVVKNGDLSITGGATADSVQLDLTAGILVSQGQMAWNADEETVDIGLNGAVLQAGQEVHYHARNNTGVLIPDGTAVMATGTIGASGRITIGLMDGSDIANAKFFLGITTEAIADGTDGKVTFFGKVRGIKTDYATWADGQVLWVDNATPGGLTNVEPTSASRLPIAFIINSAANGSIAVRSTDGTYLAEAHDTQISSETNGDILQYNGTAWVNAQQLVLDPNLNYGSGTGVAFGDGDTVLYEGGDDSLRLNVSGTLLGVFKSDQFQWSSAAIGTIVPTATIPNILSNSQDANTGLGTNTLDQLSLISGGTEMLRLVETGVSTTDQIIIAPAGVIGSAVTPALAFGDGNTGFYENVDNSIYYSRAGINKFQFSAEGIAGFVTGHSVLGTAVASSATVPGHTYVGDYNTGMGRAAADQLSLISGGIEGLRLEEASSHIIQVNEHHTGITASTTQTQVGAFQLLSSYNQVATVANDDDAVKLFDAAVGRVCGIGNQSSNILQIFPASGDDLGNGVDQSIQLHPKENIVFAAGDSTNWAIRSQTESPHAQAYDEDNTDAFVINAQDDLHSYHTNGIVGGELLAFTFDAGGGGTSFPIASIADGAATGVDIEVTTTGSHGLAVDDVVSQTNLTSAVYTGIFVVKAIISVTQYEVEAVFTATDTGTMDQAATITADQIAEGDYNITWYSSATSASSNETFYYAMYKNATRIPGTKTRRKFGIGGDFGSMSGGALTSVVDGDKLSFVLSNTSSNANATLRDFTIVVTSL